jgi:hypothetical protein
MTFFEWTTIQLLRYMLFFTKSCLSIYTIIGLLIYGKMMPGNPELALWPNLLSQITRLFPELLPNLKLKPSKYEIYLSI